MIERTIQKKAGLFIVFYFLFFIVFLGISQAEEEPKTSESPIEYAPITGASEESPAEALDEEKKETPSVSFTLTQINLSGNTKIKSSELTKIFKPFIGIEVKHEDLQAIADGISELYIERGFSAVAYLPEQTIVQGVVEITVLEGTIGEMRVTGNEYYTDHYVRGHLLRARKSLLISDWERGLLLLNDTQDLVVTSEFVPGVSLGKTDVNVNVSDRLPLHASLSYNNFGSRFVSRDRYIIRASIGTPSGGLFSITGLFASPIDELTYIVIDASHPINYNGTKVHAYYSTGDFLLGQDFRALNLNGESRNYGLSISHPFIRTRVRNLTGEIGIEDRYFTQENNIEFENALLVSPGLRYDRTSTWRQYYISAFLTFGLGEGLSQDNFQRSNPNADNHFTKLNITAGQDVPLSHNLSFNIRGAMQHSGETLESPERFVLGGFGTVRGFFSGEFLGNSGFNATAELTYSPRRFRRAKVFSFIDYGQVSRDDDPVKDPFLSGYGVGASYLMRIKRGYFSARLDVGWPLSFDSALTAPRPLKEPIYYIQATLGI